MNSANRPDLIKLAVEKHVGSWAYSEASDLFIALDDHFANSIAVLMGILTKQVQAFEAFFAGLDPDELSIAAGVAISTNRPSFADELEELISALQRRLSNPDKFYLMALGAHPHERANFSMWANNDSFTEVELMWLSIGLEPNTHLLDAFQAFKNGKRGVPRYVGEEAEKRLKIIKRSKTLQSYGSFPISGRNAFEWINSIELRSPSGFRKMLETVALRLEGKAVSAVKIADVGSDQLDSRERAAMSKLIAAMAIDCYGFDPTAKRSDIPNEIQGIADRLGLQLSTNTIRKYLRQGSELLPDDWEPQ